MERMVCRDCPDENYSHVTSHCCEVAVVVIIERMPRIQIYPSMWTSLGNGSTAAESESELLDGKVYRAQGLGQGHGRQHTELRVCPSHLSNNETCSPELVTVKLSCSTDIQKVEKSA